MDKNSLTSNPKSSNVILHKTLVMSALKQCKES
jgi:hypothetical protein